MSEHPFDVLSVFIEDALLDLPPEDYEPEFAALRAVEQLEGLLSRFREWDALNPPPDPIPAPFADLPFWIAEIDRTLALFDRKEQP